MLMCECEMLPCHKEYGLIIISPFVPQSLISCKLKLKQGNHTHMCGDEVNHHAIREDEKKERKIHKQ